MKTVALIRLLAACCVFPALSAYSAPIIEVDKTTYECGTVIEENTEKISAQFIISNTGDAPLKISNVRPGCGCTVVSYDSVIMPGKTGIIKPEVKISGYRGDIKKSISVNSNAKNKPNFQLFITARIQQILDVSEQYIVLGMSGNAQGKDILIATTKKDLAITEVVFKQAPTGNSSWSQEIAIPVKYSFAATDSMHSDGWNVFRIKLFPAKVTAAQGGEFLFKTNHPEKSEIRIPGMFDL